MYAVNVVRYMWTDCQGELLGTCMTYMSIPTRQVTLDGHSIERGRCINFEDTTVLVRATGYVDHLVRVSDGYAAVYTLIWQWYRMHLK
jgi:hypothetical protein